MKKSRYIAIFLTLLFINVLSIKSQTNNFLNNYTNGAYIPKSISNIYHFNDGIQYAIVSNDKKSIETYNYKTGKKNGTVFSLNSIKDCPLKSITGYEFSNDEQKILLHGAVDMIYRRSYTTTYYVYSRKYKTFEPLSTKTVPQQIAHFSPDGRMIAFSYENNLYIKKLDYGTQLQITTDGKKDSIINGTPDWVYEEEFEQIRYFDWSPDSKLLAYIKFNDTMVSNFSFQFFKNYSQPDLYTYRYPEAGTSNPSVDIYVYDVFNRTTKKMDIGEDKDIYIPQIQWSNNPNELTAVKLNRSQNQLDLLAINPRNGISSDLYTEHSKTFVDYENLNCLQFNSDNSFVLLSEKDGFRHAYLFTSTGLPDHQITKGNWDVTDFYGYDEKTKMAYFQAAKISPTKREVYSVDAKGKYNELSTKSGTNSASFSKDYKYAIAQFNNINTPNLYTIITNKGKVLTTLESNNDLKQKVAALNLPQKEFFQFTTPQGITLNGFMIKPENMQSGKKYPLVMVQYSGPNSQMVLDRWSIGWEYDLANQGYVVACVDGRGTGARGTEFRNCTYLYLGKLETEDQISAAKYFAQQPYIDGKRMAIWGWSFGGYMTLSCMIHGDGIFKAGIAVAPVTDWELYDSAYGERFMNRPQENYKGYAETNLLDKASQLKGNLLLVHGMADDNVHTLNSYLMVDSLVNHGIQFEMQLYPNKNHSILGQKTRYHLYSRFNKFLKDNL